MLMEDGTFLRPGKRYCPPFVICALPRSRTFWMSRFLTYADWTCHHEELRHARSMNDIADWFAQPCTGVVETTAAPWWRLVRSDFPDVRFVTIRRPVAEVVESLGRLGFDRAVMLPAMRRLNAKLDQIEARVPGVLSVTYDDLEREETCARVFTHCLPYDHDTAWWMAMSERNLQINMVVLARYYEAYRGQMTRLAAIARHRSIAAMARPRDPPEGVTFQEETIDTCIRDGAGLMADHLALLGETPDYRAKNVALLRAIEGLGALQIVSARSNGRMFGYLAAVISPSLEAPDVMSAQHAMFYCDPSIKGLGLKLQRESVARLRAKGIDEVFLRAGVRGSGPRLGTLYRRMGAEPLGELYKLETKGTASWAQPPS